MGQSNTKNASDSFDGALGGALMGVQYQNPSNTTNNLGNHTGKSFRQPSNNNNNNTNNNNDPNNSSPNNSNTIMNVGNLAIYAASLTSDTLLMSIAELILVLQQLGEVNLVVLLEEISRHYYEINIGGNFSSLMEQLNLQQQQASQTPSNNQNIGATNNRSSTAAQPPNYGANNENPLKKYINAAKYTQVWAEDEGLFGGGSGSLSRGSGMLMGSRVSLGVHSNEDEDTDEDTYGYNYNTDSAFQVWLIALKDRQLPRFKRKLEKLFVDNSGGARKVAFSFNVQMSTSSTNSLRRASSFMQSQMNPRTNYVIDMDSKQKYFEVRSEMEIILTHTLEEIKDLKECLDSKRKLEGGTANTSGGDTVDVSILFQGYEFEGDWWEKKIGSGFFSVKKKAFIDAIEETFAHMKIKWDIDVLEEISDPTCDGVVSVTDLKTLARWVGSIFKWMDELKMRNIAGKDDPSAPVIFLPHFWGSISCYDAQDILQKEEPGTFIIRFNENEPGSFYISCVQEDVAEESSNNTGFFATRQVYHFILRRSKTEKGDPLYYLCDADKSYKFKSITELLDKNYFLTFKYPYVNDELKSAVVSKKRDVDVFGALKSLSGEDDLNPYPFVVYKGKYVEVDKKKDSDVKKFANLVKKNTEQTLNTNNANSSSLNNLTSSSSSSSLKDGGKEDSGIVRVDSVNVNKEETLDLSE